VTRCVAVNGSVVENAGEPAVTVADGQRIVGDESLGEDLHVTLAGLVRLGEVVGEVGADQLLPLHAGDLHGRLVDVGDLPFRGDGDQRVQGGLDQGTGVLGRLFLGRDVTRRGEHTQDVPQDILVDGGVVEDVDQLPFLV